MKNAFVFTDKGKSLDDLQVMLVDIFDLQVDGVHSVDSIDDFIFLRNGLLL
jgi:hypothetical protein